MKQTKVEIDGKKCVIIDGNSSNPVSVLRVKSLHTKEELDEFRKQWNKYIAGVDPAISNPPVLIFRDLEFIRTDGNNEGRV